MAVEVRDRVGQAAADIETDVKFKIAAARRILYREGMDSQIGGHVSARPG